MKQIDNINLTLKDELKRLVKEGNIVNVAAATFSMHAYRELKNELKRIKELII